MVGIILRGAPRRGSRAAPAPGSPLSIIVPALTDAYLEYLSFKHTRSRPGRAAFVVDPKGTAFSCFLILLFFFFLLLPSPSMILLRVRNLKELGSPPLLQRRCFALPSFLHASPFTFKVLPSRRGTGVAGDTVIADSSRGEWQRTPGRPRSAPHPHRTQPPRRKYPSRAAKWWPGLPPAPTGR